MSPGLVAAEHPDRVAVVMGTSGETLTLRCEYAVVVIFLRSPPARWR